MPLRHLEDVFKICLLDVFSVTMFRLPRRRCLQDVLREFLKTSSRRLGRRKIVMLKTCWRRLQDMSWRRLQDVLKTNKCLLGSELFPTDREKRLEYYGRWTKLFLFASKKKTPMIQEHMIIFKVKGMITQLVIY